MKKLLISILILAVTIPVFSYAISMPNVQNSAFLSCEETEAVQGEKVVLSLNLDLIKYDNFEFTLTADEGIENVSLEEKNINIETDSDGLKLTANKADINVKQFGLYYQIPEEARVGTEINLIGTLKENKSETVENEEVEEEKIEATDKQEEAKREEVIDEADMKVEEQSKSEDSKKEQATEKESIQNLVENKEENVVEEVTITITVVEKKEENKQETLEKDTLTKEPNENNKTNTEALKTEQSVVAGMQTVQTKTVSSNIQSSTATTNTYNGESNNYLETLEVDGQSFYPAYTKTNTTYFLEVENTVTELDITAEAEDYSAKVRIYGNTELKVGENKVLISVTAENGEVKTYRIYVTRK